MAKFINKKEKVYDFKLTPYGHYLLSIGAFKPEFYGFFDDKQDPGYEVSGGDLWLSDNYQKDYQKFLKEKII